MLRLLLLLCSAVLSTLCVANNREGEIISVKSDGTTRRALVYAPQGQKSAAPLVFVFHGRGGSMTGISKKIDIHNFWSEAIVVYPQGMWCEGGYRDGLGWVISDTEDEGRDIRFFDVLLEYLKKNYKVDADNIFATGHSNGGGFTYALWAFRGDKFKAFAPSASSSRRLGENAKRRVPKPVFIISGEQDDIVPIARVRRDVAEAKRINGCTDKSSKFTDSTTIYYGENGADVVDAIHPYGHDFLRALLPDIVRFFKSVCKE
jgi:polyhydroxybutyrate depolymerase